MRGAARLLTALAILGCSGEGGEREPDPAAETADASADSFPELRTYRLLLVNRRPIEVIVLADAGADSVVLDTVARLDSTRVNVQVRALGLRLVATDRWGEILAAESIELLPDTLVRWEVPPSGSDREPAGRI